jgi:predicted amidohydrolase YtcJ
MWWAGERAPEDGNSVLTIVLTSGAADFSRFRQLGVIAALHLLWASAGEETIEPVKPYPIPNCTGGSIRSLLDTGATISGASDRLVSRPNVFEVIYQQKRARDRKVSWIPPNECRVKALRLHAQLRTCALNQQDSTGSSHRGTQADLVLVDRDVLTDSPEELKDTKGLVVYDRWHDGISCAAVTVSPEFRGVVEER